MGAAIVPYQYRRGGGNHLPVPAIHRHIHDVTAHLLETDLTVLYPAALYRTPAAILVHTQISITGTLGSLFSQCHFHIGASDILFRHIHLLVVQEQFGNVLQGDTLVPKRLFRMAAVCLAVHFRRTELAQTSGVVHATVGIKGVKDPSVLIVERVTDIVTAVGQQHVP